MIITNILGVGLIALIIWWFWLYKPAAATLGNGSVVIRVEDGSYQPSRIRVPAHQATTLQFIRKDPSPCAETVLFPEIELSESLPVDTPVSVSLPPLAPGDYNFHCQMQMYRGVVEAK